ncbi:MAG TPA: hypothetical protein VFM86_09245 [Pedococcus sp.]|nr:hypothetical protein [Pedococcus sp.]
MALVDMLLKDPSITSQQKIMGVIQLHAAGLLSDEAANDLLMGEKSAKAAGTISATVLQCGCKPA